MQSGAASHPHTHARTHARTRAYMQRVCTLPAPTKHVQFHAARLPPGANQSQPTSRYNHPAYQPTAAICAATASQKSPRTAKQLRKILAVVWRSFSVVKSRS
eukprot:3913988-Alexandrium_andersonii.AAC.1